MSPELALVDAGLAAHLRAIPDAPMRHLASAPFAGHEHDEPACETGEHSTDAPVARIDEREAIADVLVAEEVETRLAEPPTFGTYEDDPSAELFVQETGQQAEGSGYPALPSPTDGDEPSDATETVLREIRNRLTPPTSERRHRRFRRRFIVASD